MASKIIIATSVECRRFFCYECETQEENEPIRKCISICDTCEGDYCADCCLVRNCDKCGDGKCSKCSTMKECQDCVDLFCEECSPPYVQKCQCGGMNRCSECATCVACQKPHCDDCFPVKLYCDCWDGEHCKDCADMNQAGSCNCCLDITCNKCIEVVSCEGCKKSNCSRCVDGRDYDVEVCEDCGRGFCFDCRLSECAKDWDGACRKCARKVGINLPQRCLPKFYLYHSAVWEDVKKNNPGAGYFARSAILVQQYRSLSMDEKSYWKDKAKMEKEHYKEEIAGLEGKFSNLIESPKWQREYDFESAIQYNSPAFLEAMYQHGDDTRRLLEESRLKGEKSVPSDKMQEARERNLVDMKANNILGVLPESVWLKCIAKAEDDAVTRMKLKQSLKEKEKKRKENICIERVMSQAGCSRDQAFKALMENDWDFVNAIMASCQLAMID